MKRPSCILLSGVRHFQALSIVDCTCTGSLLKCFPELTLDTSDREVTMMMLVRACLSISCPAVAAILMKHWRQCATEWFFQNYFWSATVQSLPKPYTLKIVQISYLLGLLAMIKCSICSYQCDNWYVSNWRLACHINFSSGGWSLELAQGLLHVALALHIARSGIPFGVTWWKMWKWYPVFPSTLVRLPPPERKSNAPPYDLFSEAPYGAHEKKS